MKWGCLIMLAAAAGLILYWIRGETKHGRH